MFMLSVVPPSFVAVEVFGLASALSDSSLFAPTGAACDTAVWYSSVSVTPSYGEDE